MHKLPMFAAAALLAPVPAIAAEIQIPVEGPVVELSVNETVKVKPDLVNVGAGVSTLAPTAVQAMQQNAREMDSVIAKIKALGIAKEDVQTTGINLNAEYDYNQSLRKQVFRGYRASNQVQVTLRKVEDTGKVLDALVAAGPTDINGPSFSVEDDSAAKAQARKAAMKHAHDQAMEYAQFAGYSGVRLLEVSESITSSRPMPMMRMAADAVAAAPPPPVSPVEPGLVGTGVTVSVKYEMTR
ncbi:MAG: SIMPL domain-containing protein [Novosphingobium sp.]|nr:SIMPL domain-containing protein [Novosphingobium sp.]